MADDERREITVPLRLYKTVIVFSTLFAIAGVVGGFVLLDRATGRGTRDPAAIDPVVAVAGLALILAGATVYVFGARFRAPGMGKPKEGDDEGRYDG